MNTPNTIKIIRYSTTGFKPQKQTHHLKDVDYHMYDFNINDYPEYARYNISQIHKKTLAFYKEHLTDLKEGIWFFIDGHKNNQSLNHLKRKVPCWEAEIESDAYVYDVNWKYITDLSDPFVKLAGCYLPKSQMSKIHNLKKKKRIPYIQLDITILCLIFYYIFFTYVSTLIKIITTYLSHSLSKSLEQFA